MYVGRINKCRTELPERCFSGIEKSGIEFCVLSVLYLTSHCSSYYFCFIFRHVFIVIIVIVMKFSVPVIGALAGLSVAQTPAPYTDAKSGITFNAYIDRTSGYFFGIALPSNTTGNTDFIATIGSKGTGYAGASLGGGMLGKLLVLAWPNGQTVVSSFRKTA